MVLLPDLKWIIDCDYNGRILFGEYSSGLKRKVADYIAHYHAFDKIDNPAMPYISAWSRGHGAIWYEYAGKHFRHLFSGPETLSEDFSSRVLDRCIYQKPTPDLDITKTTLSSDKLADQRHEIRRQGQEDGHVNAVYKIATKDHPLWLKDQATIETFPEVNLCIARGILVDVTNEMMAEEQLKKVQRELQSHRQHLKNTVRDRTRRLWKSQMEVVSRLARAAEFRDNKTGTHLTKISRYCKVIGRAAGLPKVANTLLYLASPMHDIGKIGISDTIHQKPGKLTSGEFDQMKAHCDIGASLLSGDNSDLLRVARSIAISHHERWDGNGYPNGLSQDSIPLSGRITAICDVFDALTSDRPYKRAWPVDHAITEIKKGKGSHFDPDLVTLFMNNINEIKGIHQQHSAN